MLFDRVSQSRDERCKKNRATSFHPDHKY
jgi:hypothetical protein